LSLTLTPRLDVEVVESILSFFDGALSTVLERRSSMRQQKWVEQGWRPLRNGVICGSEALGKETILGKEAKGAKVEA